jgi:3-isopropylmalate dehydratase small subunit
MSMTLIEKILARHSGSDTVRPGEIVDIGIDIRIARDFGGANVVRNLVDNDLEIDDPSRTYFTFDCNPTGSDQKYATNQHICRMFAREKGIGVYDIDKGIGTHVIIDEGIVYPWATAISTDSHANLLGAVGAFGQGMGDLDITAGWNKGKVWFKIPHTVKIILKGEHGNKLSAKDLVLNLLGLFGSNTLLGYSVELYGKIVEKLTLDQRITIASLATVMGAVTMIIPPSKEIYDFCAIKSKKKIVPLYADPDAFYIEKFDIDMEKFRIMVSRPGAPHDVVEISEVHGYKIDSAFIGSCTNGRLEDMQKAADILKGRVVAPGVILKVVPSTDEIWKACLERGLIEIFKKSGALVSNAGCAGCASGQVGQNGQGEVTISTGNRNFQGKQGMGNVYLASPEVVAASAVAGFITTPGSIPDKPGVYSFLPSVTKKCSKKTNPEAIRDIPLIIVGRIWIIGKNDVDTDMIFHNRYLSVTDISEMGQYTFGKIPGFEDFSKKAQRGDIVIAGKNFGSGSSRQQAVDCFISLGIQAIVAESFGAIYERNAINAAFPIITCKDISKMEKSDGDILKINLLTGELLNLRTGECLLAESFSQVQLEIYLNGGLF